MSFCHTKGEHDQPRIEKGEGVKVFTVQDALRGIAKSTCPECAGTGLVANHVEIGNRLKSFTKSRQLSSREVAKRMGLSPMYVCDLEHGRRSWRPELIERYLEAVNK